MTTEIPVLKVTLPITPTATISKGNYVTYSPLQYNINIIK